MSYTVDYINKTVTLEQKLSKYYQVTSKYRGIILSNMTDVSGMLCIL